MGHQFALDLREGDVFKVIVERSSIGGQPIGEDRILGASFDNFGTEHVGLRYIDSNARMGYYTPEGASLRKAFLRDPVHFSHVSSSFNLRRKHPIHNRTMPHRALTTLPIVAPLCEQLGKAKSSKQNAMRPRAILLLCDTENATPQSIYISPNSLKESKRVPA